MFCILFVITSFTAKLKLRETYSMYDNSFIFAKGCIKNIAGLQYILFLLPNLVIIYNSICFD